MSNNFKYTKAFTMVVTVAVLFTGCTKKREAALPFDARENIFSISELDTLKSSKSISIQTAADLSEMSLAEASKAVAESSMIEVKKADAPERLAFMFEELQITGSPNKKYDVVISVDQQYVTAYKKVSGHQELSTLEQQIAQNKEEIELQKNIQKATTTTAAKPLASKLEGVRKGKIEKSWSAAQPAYVPLFRFKVAKYGILERTKNSLDEETATLQLKESSWTKATHVQISTESKDRIAFGITDDLNRTFVMNSINNKVLTAKTLNDDFKIPLALEPSTKVLTLLDVKSMRVFEVGQLGKTPLSDSQKNQLKLANGQSNVRKCTPELVKLLPADEQEGCIIILRYDVPVSYVTTELPEPDVNGRLNTEIKLKEVPAGKNVGLVKIPEYVQATKVEDNNMMDPRTTLKVSEIKGKEFFFKRTLEDAPVTTILPPGMAGDLTIVKFDMQEKNLAVIKADSIKNLKYGNTATDIEEIMTIPVKYLKYEVRDASGNKYAMPQLVQTNRNEAEFIEINWADNRLEDAYSPYASVNKMCLVGLGAMTVSDVDMKMDKGSLNFTLDYSASLSPYCVGNDSGSDDYSIISNRTVNARLKERVSFKVNDGSTDKSFALNLPFSAQNKLGYGVWTIAKANPTATGLKGREGQQIHNQVVHDFRNGKKLVYTVTGLEPEASIDPEIKELFIETTKEVVNAWDLAYRQVFKGQKDYERSGRFVEVQFAGYNGVTGRVGDIDKNIIHYENKFNDNHGVLGVSQVGFNPRSGIVVADSLVIYAGNLQQSIAGSQRATAVSQEWLKQKENIKADLMAKLTADEKAQASKAQTQKMAENKAGSSQEKINTALQSVKSMTAVANNIKKDNLKALKANRVNHNALAVYNAVNTFKATGGLKQIDFASPNTSYGWMDKVFKAINKNPQMEASDIQGIVAQEILSAQANKLSEREKASLTFVVKSTEAKATLKKHFSEKPGCFMMNVADKHTRFAKRPFKEALKNALYFDLAHEMGHSQGLTHNFIASFDKANFGNHDGAKTTKNYSSVMDYMPYEEFNWDGIGRYDIHALRASQLGLVEAAKSADGANQTLVKITDIQKKFAPNGWQNFTKRQIKDVVRSYKYCTDIDVGYEPTCARFDAGSSAVEIMDNLIYEFYTSYDTAYHGWDRYEFDYYSAIRAKSYSVSTMYKMRQFMDEYFFKMFFDRENQEELKDLGSAALKAYYFYNNVVRAPDKSHSFKDPRRFELVKYEYMDYDQKTGKELGIKQDVQFVENRPLDSFEIDDRRLDTVGFEFNKVTALNLLSMKYYPHYKYIGNNVTFSFMDFEKYILGMGPSESLYVQAVLGLLLDQLNASIATPKSPFQIINQKLDASVTLRSYAAIYSILNLEAATLREVDNSAAMFKVGSTIGAAPTDRASLTNLGVDAKSTRKVNYFAADSAIVADVLVNEGSQKAFGVFLAKEMKQNLQKMFVAQLSDILGGGNKKAEVAAAKKVVLDQATALNKDGRIVTAEEVKENPALALDKQIDMIENLNLNAVLATLGLMDEDKAAAAEANQMAVQLMSEIKVLEGILPLVSANSAAVKSVTEILEQQNAKNGNAQLFATINNVISQLMDGSKNEVSYGILMKNLELLARITEMTNPELSRQ